MIFGIPAIIIIAALLPLLILVIVLVSRWKSSKPTVLPTVPAQSPAISPPTPMVTTRRPRPIIGIALVILLVMIGVFIFRPQISNMWHRLTDENIAISPVDSGAEGDSSITVTVPANQSWTYVCRLKAGQHFAIKASGTWDCSGGIAPVKDLPCTGSGMEAPYWIPDRHINGYPYQAGRVIHNLIGRIDGHVFNIGNEFEGIAENSGVLYVGPNDYDLHDNDGSLLLTVNVDN